MVSPPPAAPPPDASLPAAPPLAATPPATPAPNPWLAPGEVLLHVGVHKTGTTALQAALAAARPRLVDLGVAYPGDAESHHTAAAALTGRRPPGASRPATAATRPWDDLASTVRATTGTVLLSSELFCEAEPDVAARIVADLGRPRVRVLVTLRPLDQLLPSSWQQYVKSGLAMPYRRWLRKILQGPGQAKVTPSFWKRNDHGAQVALWSDLVGADRVTVLVVDPARPDALFEAYERLAGLPSGTLHQAPTAASNRGLSAAEAEVISRLNAALGPAVDPVAYANLVRRGAILNLVEGRRPSPGEPRLVTPDWAAARAREFAQEAIRRIDASGAAVIGDLRDLLGGSDPPADVPAPDSVPVDAATLLLSGMVQAAAGVVPEDAVSGHRRGLAHVPTSAITAELRRRAPADVAARVGGLRPSRWRRRG